MATWRKTTYREHFPKGGPGVSPVFHFSQDGSRCIRVLNLPNYDNLYQAVLDFLGWSNTVIAGPAKYIQRVTPHFIKGFTIPEGANVGLPFLFATSISDAIGVGVPADKNC